MNIMFINSISRHKLGGGEKWMVMAARGLADAGHRTILASKTHSETIKLARQQGVETKTFNIHGDFGPINTIRIARFLRSHRIDVLICNLNKDVRVAGLAARIVRKPVVIARHGMLLCGRAWRHKLTLTRLTDGILTNSQSIKNAYHDYGWFDENFVKVIYNGVEVRSHVDAYDFGTDFPGKKIILSAGRLDDQKGFDYLIRAAAILRHKRDDLVFIIAGKGRKERIFKNLADEMGVSDRVVFIGHKPDLAPYQKGCDLFVLASRFEGMPNVILEAMAVGKAVVATAVNGVGEIVENDKTGRVISPHDPAALAHAIDHIIDNDRMLKRYGTSGQKRVREHFTIPIMVENLENYFKEMVEKKSL